jgi:hypothetical protein
VAKSAERVHHRGDMHAFGAIGERPVLIEDAHGDGLTT